MEPEVSPPKSQNLVHYILSQTGSY